MSAFVPNDDGRYDRPENNQGLADDPLAVPGVSFGVLIIGAIGWLLAAIAIIGLPWPMPGAQPTVSGPVLERLLTSVPDDPLVTAIARHVVDLGAFIMLIAAPIALVAAAGRRSRLAAGALALIGALGIVYAAGMALYLGAMVAVWGFVLIMISALLGWATWIPPRAMELSAAANVTDQNAPGEIALATDGTAEQLPGEPPASERDATPDRI
jgi:hypothetical protein